MTAKQTFALAILLMASPASATKPVPPPTMNDLAHVWIGTSIRGILDFFRLEVSDKGVGTLTIQYLPDEPAVAYQVTKTTLTGFTVVFSVKPIDKEAEPLLLRGHASATGLDLEASEPVGGWRLAVFLQREENILGRLKAVTDRAARLRSRN